MITETKLDRVIRFIESSQWLNSYTSIGAEEISRKTEIPLETIMEILQGFQEMKMVRFISSSTIGHPRRLHRYRFHQRF